MKKHQLILLCTLLFVVLFYDESLGLNLGILGISYAIFTAFKTPERNRTHTFFVLIIATVLSSIAFAWYGDLVSFLALVMSMALLAFKSRSKNLKSLLVIPTFTVSFFTFLCRIFYFDQWIQNQKSSGMWQKIFAIIVIPSLFLATFFAVYASGSTYFSELLYGYELDFNLWEFVIKAVIGFFIAFNFWNYWVPKFFIQQNEHFQNEFRIEERKLKPTYNFLSIDAERMSGVVTFLALNILIVFFIVTFNYEQFYEVQKSANQLSIETHERVNAVIISILMAIGVIMFYFKSTFNFDEKASLLKGLAIIWIVLNAVLVISAMAKNIEYIINFGMTYKRLGVCAFLILSLIGLFFTFFKVKKSKTNAYLFNHMAWYFYGAVLVSSFINWGAIATRYNIENKKGDLNFLMELNFNDKILDEHFPQFERKYNSAEPTNNSFLSTILYDETLKK